MNTVTTIEKQQAVYGIFIEMKKKSDTDDNEIKYSIINSKSFDYKASFIGSVTRDNLVKNNVKIVVPLKYLSNFWKSH